MKRNRQPTIAIDPAAAVAVAQLGERDRQRWAWEIDPETFEVRLFDPDADGVFCPHGIGRAVSYRRDFALEHALTELKSRRRAINAAIVKATRELANAKGSA